MPNLLDVCPIGRDSGGRSYVTQMVGRNGPSQWCRGPGGTLGAGKSYSGGGSI